MTTAAQILLAIEIAVDLASAVPLEEQERRFPAFLSGALKGHGKKADELAAKVFALGERVLPDAKGGA
jgi:hypothetical protein